jgi:hypothetical protein
MVAGCSRSEATRPTLASQVNPNEPSTLGKDATRHETVPDLAPSVAFSIPVLDGEDGGFRYPIKSIKFIYQWVKYLEVFERVLVTFSCLKMVILCQNRNFKQLIKMCY